VAQHARGQVGAAAVGVDDGAGAVARHGVDGQVAALQVLLERDLG
jgi:hypothetical protein